MNRPRAIPLALAAACYVLALVQRPGETYVDTKVDLHVDPRSFLGDVASAWTDQIQLGHVFGGQYGGYLFPMAPWFWLGDALGLPAWVVQRLWLGTVLAVAAIGVVRLLDALLDRARGAPHVAAAILFVLNPYVAVYTNRTTITLLAYAALPWLLLAVHRGLRDPRGWRWPAAFALVLTCTGGGVNVAVTGWVLLGPALFVAYERWIGGVGPGAIRPFLLRLAPVVAIANLWWVVPVVVHAGYGLDFLPFTEQPGTIWQTTSITESLRLTGFWTSYIGLGFGGLVRPYASHGHVLLFHPPVVVASLLVPALALGGFAWTRRWRYGPWFVLLALAGLLAMVAGFPEGTPLRRALTFTYNEVQPVQFLRTTYKAGPLLALGLACLAGGAFGVLWDRARRWRPAAAAAALALAALAAWPLTTGRAPESQLAIDVPSWWEQTAERVDRLPPGERAMVMPGRLFAYYDWGGTIDPVLPALADRPVAERMLVPFADLRAVDLQFATDALISQERVLPGQLGPLLDAQGVGLLVTNADDDRSRSGAIGPVEAADAFARAALRPPRGIQPIGVDPELAATAAVGPRRLERPAAGRLRAGERLPRVTTRVLETGGMVRVVPRRAPAIVDGGAEGIAALAGFGAFDPSRALRYAADLDARELRRAAREGAEVVVTDTNRRQAFVAARLRANRGRVLPADASLSQDGAMLDPFARGPDAQTVARYDGIDGVTAPASPQTTQFPEHRPFAAVDGDPSTAWLADRALARDRHWVEVDLRGAARDVPFVDVLPYSDERGRVLRMAVNGRSLPARPGWNRVRVGGPVERVRVAIEDVSQPPGVSGGAGGVREIRVPGVRARERLRPPVLAERALRGQRPARLTYLFSRLTTDAPLRTAGPVDAFQSYRVRDRVDPERRLARRIAPPLATSWAVDAWTSPDPAASDAVLDRLAGTEGPVRATSSARADGAGLGEGAGAGGGGGTGAGARSGSRLGSGPARATATGRFGGLPAHRASRALDGDPRTAWIAPWVVRAGSRTPPGATIAVELDLAQTVRRLRLVPPRTVVRVPQRVRVAGEGPGGGTFSLPVLRDGTVVLPRPLRARRFTLTVERARFPRGATGAERQRRAVGIAELRGIPGARVRDAAASAPLRGRCGDARVRTAGGEVALRPAGDVAALESGEPLRATACEDALLPAGEQDVLGGDGVLRVDHLRLRRDRVDALGTSTPETQPVAAAGRVLDPGDDGGRGTRSGARIRVDEPAWLVLGQGYNRGWRATCDGDDLGEPVPLQGYANAWPVDRSCADLDFAWAPNRLLAPAYAISLLGCFALLALLLVARRRARAEVERGGGQAPATGARLAVEGVEGQSPNTLPDADAAIVRWPWPRAVAAGALAAAVLGFVFALRAGLLLGPAVALILAFGVPAKRLALAGGALLAVVVPILYLAVPVRDPGGFNTNLAVERIAAHWVGVAAVFLLGAALWRTLAGARAAHPARPRLPRRRRRVRADAG